MNRLYTLMVLMGLSLTSHGQILDKFKNKIGGNDNKAPKDLVVGDIAFFKTEVESDADQSTSTKSFSIGDEIYGVANLTVPLKNAIKWATQERWNEESDYKPDVGFMYNVTCAFDKEGIYRTPKWRVRLKGIDGNSTKIAFALVPSTDEIAKEKDLQLFVNRLNELTEGDHVLQVRFELYDNTVCETDISFSKTARATVSTGKKFTDFNSGLTDADTEKKMLTALKGKFKEKNGGTYIDVRIKSDRWTVFYHNVTGQPIYKQIEAWCLLKWQDGKCEVYLIRFRKDFNGQGYSGLYAHEWVPPRKACDCK